MAPSAVPGLCPMGEASVGVCPRINDTGVPSGEGAWIASLGEGGCVLKKGGPWQGNHGGGRVGGNEMGPQEGGGWAVASVPVPVHSFSKMSGEAPPGLEGRVRRTLRKVFGFESFKTSLQESATMTVARGEAQRRRDVKHVWFSVFP